MANYKISQERYEDAVNIIVQYLRDAGYSGSLEDGTGLSDIVIKPSALIYTLMSQLADKTAAHQSLAKAQELKSSMSRDEYDATIDYILSNWFITRNDGKPTYGLVRLWFLKPSAFLDFYEGQSLGTANSVALVVNKTQAFSEADFSVLYNSTNKINEYYIDVSARSAANTDIILDPSTSVSFKYSDIYFLRATIPATFTPGTSKESSSNFIARAQQAITTREMITSRAINTVLRENFDEIYSLYVARYGSKEQLRDIVNFDYYSVHVGNKADIYIASPITKMTAELTFNLDGSLDLSQLPASTTILSYLSLQDSNDQDIPFTLQVEETRLGSSGCLPITFTAAFPDLSQYTEDNPPTATLTMLVDSTLSSMQDFIYSDNQRVVCYDPLIKHKFIMHLHIHLDIELDPEDDTDKETTTARIKQAVLNYIQNINENVSSWVCSELVTAIHNAVRQVQKVTLPITCQGIIFDPATNANIQVEINNQFDIDSNLTARHSKQISSNTVQFYSDADLITVSLK